jgi:hypothetical protein
VTLWGDPVILQQNSFRRHKRSYDEQQRHLLLSTDIVGIPLRHSYERILSSYILKLFVKLVLYVDTLSHSCCCCSRGIKKKLATNSVAWVCERTIRTEQPLLIGEVSAKFCGWIVPSGQLN